MCARVGGCAATSGRRRGLGCGLLGAVVLLQEVPMEALERAEGGSIPCVGVLDVVAWQQPDLLSREQTWAWALLKPDKWNCNLPQNQIPFGSRSSRRVFINTSLADREKASLRRSPCADRGGSRHQMPTKLSVFQRCYQDRPHRKQD